MAHILYLEDDETSVLAFEGLINRTPHTLQRVESATDAWDALTADFAPDMLVMEVRLTSEQVWSIIKQIRQNRFLKKLPIVVYSKVKDRNTVQSIVDLDIQNYLFKPYREQQLFEEILKAEDKKWKLTSAGNAELFERRLKIETRSFLIENNDLLEKQKALYESLGGARGGLTLSALKGKADELDKIVHLSERLNFTLYRELINELQAAIENEDTTNAKACIEDMPLSFTLQAYRIAQIQAAVDNQTNPPMTPTQKQMAQAASGSTEAVSESAPSNTAPATPATPSAPAADQLLTEAETFEKIDEISDYPVIESAAAAFRMIADEAEVHLDEIVQLVQRDPGLTASVLRFANSPFIAPSSPIEDIHQAIAALGLQRVRLLALSLKTVSEVSQLFKAFRWQDFWLHQVSVATLSEYIFSELALPGRSEIAYLSGLVAGMGKLLLSEVNPAAYGRVAKAVQAGSGTLAGLEAEVFGTSHDAVGAHFAANNAMPPALVIATRTQHNVMQAEDPAHFGTVGAVSLASYLCIQNGLGTGGDILPPSIPHAASHPAWDLFSPWLAPSLDIEKFLRQLEPKCRALKSELIGMLPS